MIVLWVGAAIALLSLLRYAGRLAVDVATVSWPEEAPLNLHDNRARDPHLAHLGRLLASDSLGEAHHTVVDVTERLLASGSVTLHIDSTEKARRRLGPSVESFLARPPLGSPQRYRRDLAAALTRIEDL